ncbi:MAG: ABC transporter substrate-binding protein [Pseudomonadota bacterium]
MLIKHFCCALLFTFASLGAFALAEPGDRSYVVTDSFGKHRLQKPPERVVVTDWALLEQLIELGISPVGAPELDRYRFYVKQPALPESIVDIGLRRKPSLQTLEALEPDVVILGTDQKDLSRPFSHIAPVMYYRSFSDKYRTNGKKSRVRFLQLADLFQRRELAETKLADMDKEIATIREQLQAHFETAHFEQSPRVTVVRFSSEEKILVYGKNSMALHTLEQLGLESGMTVSRSKWGYKELPISALNEIRDGIILYIEPLGISEALFASQKWLSLPAVKEQRVFPMNTVWSYGGAMSVLYKARAIHKALIGIPSQAENRL